jgi:tRNA(Leu) C34 or U34 (ribose-2'-O)-methylase TrmL
MNPAIDPAAPADLTIALYQPDIPQNAGTILRMCACLSLAPQLSSQPAFPSATAIFAAPAWTIWIT